MPDRRATSRRAILRAGAAAGLAGTTAGCLELLPPLGQRIRFGRVDAPPGDEPTYRRWFPAASALDDGHGLHTSDAIVATPRRDGRHVVGAPVGIGRSFVVGMVDYFGIGVEHYDLVVGVGGAMALEGPVHVDVVRETLLSSGYDEAGTYDGYELFDRDDGPRTTAVAEGRVVHARDDQHRRDVEALIDARAGRIERQHDVDAAFERVTSLAGLRPFLLGGPGFNLYGATDEFRYGLAGVDFDESAVYSLTYLLVRDGVDVSAEELRDRLRNVDSALLARAVDVRVDGRLAVVESRLSHAAARDGFTEEFPPHATWGVEEAADRLVLRHEAGESVPADELVLRDGNDDPLDRQFADEHDLVVPGTELAVPRTALGRPPLRVWWHPPTADGQLVLFRYEHQ